MRREELSNLRWIGKEIELQTMFLEEIRTKAEGSGRLFDGLPKGQKDNDRIAHYISRIADLSKTIEESRAAYIKEEHRLKRFIEELESSEMRLIFQLRHMQGMSWEQIGNAMGYDGSTVRKKHERFWKYKIK